MGGHRGAMLGKDDVQVMAVCDVHEGKREAALKQVEQAYAAKQNSDTCARIGALSLGCLAGSALRMCHKTIAEQRSRPYRTTATSTADSTQRHVFASKCQATFPHP